MADIGIMLGIIIYVIMLIGSLVAFVYMMKWQYRTQKYIQKIYKFLTTCDAIEDSEE